MSILLSGEILETLHHELQNADESVQIISAYCKENTIMQLNGMIPSSVSNRKLMVRFRLDDIVKGSSDIAAAEYCLKEGWEVYFRFDLHVKTYIVDCKRGIIGSANATNSGLGLSRQPNLEMATLVDIEPKDMQKIAKLYQQAIPADTRLLDKMKVEISKSNSNSSAGSLSWSQEITDLFNPTVETLFSYELPDSNKLDGYIPFLDVDLNGDLQAVKNTFRWSTAYLWLLQTLQKHNGEMYFGSLTQELHNTLVTDPKPYRKDVKQQLANLLSIIEQLNMDEIVIDTPNYSQRVRLAK